MPRLSRKKNIRKRKSYRKQTKRNKKVRKLLKGGNLTPEPLSSSEMNFCTNFIDFYGNINIRDIYVKKGRNYNCEDLYYRDTEDKFHSITEKGLVTEKAESQILEDYMPIIESVHGEVSINNNTQPQTRSRKKSKVKPQKSRPYSNEYILRDTRQLEVQDSCESLGINNAEKKQLKDHYFSLPANKRKSKLKNRTNFDENTCHLYYRPGFGFQKRRGYGYLKNGRATEIQKSLEAQRNRGAEERAQRKRAAQERAVKKAQERAQREAEEREQREAERTSLVRTLPRLPITTESTEERLVYNALRPATPTSPSSSPTDPSPIYADAKEGKRLKREQAEQSQQPFYANLAFSGTVNGPSRILSLTNNTKTTYADIAETTEA